ncbi:hypothetical protein Lalb_Chr21g0319061 [Lupinus albus]|uniref:Uncharacterized protein n=1 Tax=Lupinus albus TaxID=3870 RepID=A0A6A4NSM3_LUPAL|nr:hypothetical protein Lalb_Chr21g0319061 [Lupinus albus]
MRLTFHIFVYFSHFKFLHNLETRLYLFYLEVQLCYFLYLFVFNIFLYMYQCEKMELFGRHG